MSFKREGDDTSQLNILKKRRVADLLANFIPEDEAALLKNGRYTCLVCSYRPVFDTVDTLTVHRKGKKHLEGLKAFYGKKTQLKNEIGKRQHENYVQSEEKREEPSCSAPLLAQTRQLTRHALSKAVPYNSCHRKTSTKSEKGPPRVGTDPCGNASRKMASGPEEACRKTDAPSSLAGSGSRGHAAASEGSRPSEHLEASQAVATEEAEPRTLERRRELEHYLKLKSQGWLQDRSGRWVKDEDVEFDSDEEEPPSLAPVPSSH